MKVPAPPLRTYRYAVLFEAPDDTVAREMLVRKRAIVTFHELHEIRTHAPPRRVAVGAAIRELHPIGEAPAEPVADPVPEPEPIALSDSDSDPPRAA